MESKGGNILTFNYAFAYTSLRFMAASRILCPFGAMVVRVLRNKRYAYANINTWLNSKYIPGLRL